MGAVVKHHLNKFILNTTVIAFSKVSVCPVQASAEDEHFRCFHGGLKLSLWVMEEVFLDIHAPSSLKQITTDIKGGREFKGLISHAQIQLMETKRQVETQVALYQKTKELLSAAELELNSVRLQQGSSEAHHTLSCPSTPTTRGWHKHTPTH